MLCKFHQSEKGIRSCPNGASRLLYCTKKGTETCIVECNKQACADFVPPMTAQPPRPMSPSTMGQHTQTAGAKPSGGCSGCGGGHAPMSAIRPAGTGGAAGMSTMGQYKVPPGAATRAAGHCGGCGGH